MSTRQAVTAVTVRRAVSVPQTADWRVGGGVTGRSGVMAVTSVAVRQAGCTAPSWSVTVPHQNQTRPAVLSVRSLLTVLTRTSPASPSAPASAGSTTVRSASVSTARWTAGLRTARLSPARLSSSPGPAVPPVLTTRPPPVPTTPVYTGAASDWRVRPGLCSTSRPALTATAR